MNTTDDAASTTGSSQDRITISIHDGVADVRLNRPDKLNALDNAMFGALIDAADALAVDRSVRCVVLSGEGRSFCAGLDFSNFAAMAAESSSTSGTERPRVMSDAAMEGRITHRGQQAVWGWHELPQPVICAISGHALGGGFQLALGGDIRIVHPHARLSILEMRWGLIPDMCASELLPRLVGIDVAKELTFTGRMFDGTEAGRLGIATHVSTTPHADAMALAGDIASKSPDAIRRAKQLANGFGRVDTATAFANERRLMSELMGSANQVEAVNAFFVKRDPVFVDEGY